MSLPASPLPAGAPQVLVGLIGAGIQRSQSPTLHMEEGRALGLDYRYEILDVDLVEGGASALPRMLDEAEARGFAGLNITFPCKQQVIPLLHELSEDARSLQSVNTVVFRDGKRIGHNTDWWGFAENFRRGMPDVARERVVLVGAGGAGSAVGYAALQLGARALQVHDVDQGRAAALASRLGELFPDRAVSTVQDISQSLANADGLIHASPTGMAKLPGLPVPADCLRPPLWIAEVVYVPLETELLRVARTKGCRTLDGGGMAVFQAVMAFELFCGMKPDAERMLQRFDAKLRAAS
jgi:shikimate dehydrogenase